MDPWRPKYKPLYDALENIAGAAIVAAYTAALMLIFVLTI